MLVNIIMIVFGIMLGLAIFYLIIRMKDIHKNLKEIGEKMPVMDEMRRQASDTIASLHEKIGGLSQKADRIRDVMDSVSSLKNLFIMPKGAGGAGERLLEKALHDILSSDMYQTQYGLSSGTVDFIIKFKDFLVPVDSKLSLENFNRMLTATEETAKRAFWRSFVSDVKKNKYETSKNGLTNKNTTDFELLYITLGSVYYEEFVKGKQFGEDNI